MCLCSRAPHGARGLKFGLHRKYARKLTSRPTRGAWIEMPVEPEWNQSGTVAPHTGRVD